jgi:hypothetical protein
METTYNKLPEQTETLLIQLKNYLQTPLYFYGSVQRIDYLSDDSDVDVDIFTSNEKTTIYSLINFFKLKKSDISPCVYHSSTNETIKCYKLEYNNPIKKIRLEISIYNEKDKQTILNEHINHSNMPFICTLLLLILKIFYYKLGIIDKDAFLELKHVFIHLFDKKKPFFVDLGFPKKG